MLPPCVVISCPSSTGPSLSSCRLTAHGAPYPALRRYEERKAEREARYAEREERASTAAAESGVEPYSEELLRVEQMLTYLRAFVASAEAAKPAAAKELVAPEKGMVLLKKKSDADLDDIFGGLGKPKPKATAAKPAPFGAKPAASSSSAATSSSSSKPSEPAAKKIAHTIDSLKSFMDLGITDVPNTTAEVPATIAKVGLRRAALHARAHRGAPSAARRSTRARCARQDTAASRSTRSCARDACHAGAVRYVPPALLPQPRCSSTPTIIARHVICGRLDPTDFVSFSSRYVPLIFILLVILHTPGGGKAY